MKLSVFYDHIRRAAAEKGFSIEEMLTHVRDLGITGIDIDFDTLLREENWLPEALHHAGMTVALICNGYDFATRPVREEDYEIYRLAKRCGCAAVMPIPGLFDPNAPREPQRESVLADMRAMADYGRTLGIATVMEDFDNPLSPCFDLAGLQRLFDAVPAIGCNFDTGNFLPAGEDLLTCFAALRGRVAHVHLKDRRLTAENGEPAGPAMPDGRRLYPSVVGDGVLDIAAVVRGLKADGYDGFAAIEIFGVASLFDGIGRSVAFLNTL